MRRSPCRSGPRSGLARWPSSPITLLSAVLAAVLTTGLITGCDPAPAPDIPVPTTTTTPAEVTLERDRPEPDITDPIIPPPLERGTPRQRARLDSGLLTDAEVRRLGMLPAVGKPADSFLVPQRCDMTPVDLGPNGFAAPVRTQESHGSLARPISWRQDIASVHPATAGQVIAAVADTACDTYPNMYGRFLHDYGTVDLGPLPGVAASVAFCWGSVPRGDDVGAMCVLLLHHDDLLVQLSVVTDFANATRLLPRVALAVARRLTAVVSDR